MRKLSVIVFFTAAFLFGLAAASCNKPTIIPDEKLARIFHDAYLVNAYTQTKHINLDSLNIYEPVFAKYGYTTEDVQFTIGNFTKRKSARLSDVVDRSIQMLGEESRFYQGRIAIYDTIGRRARERSARVVYTDTLISVRSVADTSKLRIVVPVKEPGTYDVSYYYTIDSTDQNNNLRVNMYLLDARNRQSSNNNRRLNRARNEKVTATFTAGEEHRKLVLNLNGYPRDLKKPSMRIDTLVVRHYMPDDLARAAMLEDWIAGPSLEEFVPTPWYNAGDTIHYVLLPDELLDPKDICPLSADSPGTSVR